MTIATAAKTGDEDRVESYVVESVYACGEYKLREGVAYVFGGMSKCRHNEQGRCSRKLPLE